MKSKQRLLNAMSGKEIDRVPWSPFLAYYWDRMSKEVRDRGQFAYLKDMGADPLLRGFARLYGSKRKNCEVIRKDHGMETEYTFHTPVGDIKEVHRYSSEGKTSFLVEHPVKSSEDIKVLQYMYENTTVMPSHEKYDALCSECRDEALIMPLLGVEPKTAFQSMVEHWLGTEQLAYAICDYPDEVQECLDVMMEKDFETVKISAESDAEAFIFWEDSSTTNISPSFFSEYTAPEIKQWGDYLHKNGKLLVHHACGHIKDLLPLMGKLPIDMIDSISPPPTGNITIRNAVELIPKEVGVIGGIEPTVFLNSSLDELEVYVKDLLDAMKGKKLVLANSDSCPPGVEYEKFLMVTQLIKNYK